MPDESTPVASQQHNAWFPVTIRELSEQRERYNIDPPFQRKTAWRRIQMQQLYETIFAGRPIGVLEGYREDPNSSGGTKFGIIDGHQRIESILKFVDNIVKTWSWAQKLKVFPGSTPPRQPARFFRDLDVDARNYFLDYRLDINIIPKMSELEMVNRFLEIQCHTPLSAAEKLYPYPSKSKDVAKRIAQNPFWEQFYIGQSNRGELFQISLCLLGVEISPNGTADLRGDSPFITSLACGLFDAQITDQVECNVTSGMDLAMILFNGFQFSDRLAALICYQAVDRLRICGYEITEKDRGKLSIWLDNVLSESKRSNFPVFVQPVKRLKYSSKQIEFWSLNMPVILQLLRA